MSINGNLGRSDDGEVVLVRGTDGVEHLGQQTMANSIPVTLASNQTPISVVGSLTPNGTAIYFSQPLADGSAENMAVNASSGSPRYFTYSPGSGITEYIESLSIFFWDSAVTNPTNFGGIAALTNGVVLEIRSKGTAYTIATIKDNMDFSKIFSTSRQAVGTSGFYENSDIYLGVMSYLNPIVLQNSTSDYIRFKVQDNISNIDQFQAHVQVWRSI